MAQRSFAKPAPEVALPRLPWRREQPAWRASVEDPKRLAWRVVTAPFWLGSDIPAPHLPERFGARPHDVGLAGEQFVTLLDRIARRLWLQRAAHILVRSGALGLLAGTLWLVVELLGGPHLRIDWLLGLTLGLVLLGIGFSVLQRPSRYHVACMLDRSFSFQERMTTALDHLGHAVPSQDQRASVVYLQMADAANVVAEMQQHPALRLRVPVREAVVAIAFGLTMAAVYFLIGVGGDLPAAATGTVPDFLPVAERPVAPEADPASDPAAMADAPTVEEVRQRAERSNQAQRDLSLLSRALEDHAVTRSAAEAIQRGDYSEAADDLRALADNVDRLSPTARQALASDLDQAAGQMSPGSDELTQASRQAADGLRQGQEPASDGVKQLGEAVESTGNEVASQQDLAQDMRQAQSSQNQQSDQSAQSGQSQSAQGDPQPGEGQPSTSAQGQPNDGAESGAQPGDQAGTSAQPGQGEPGAGEQPGQSSQPGQGDPAAGGQQPGQEGNGEPTDGSGGEAAGEGEQAAQGGGAGSGSEDSAAESDAGGAGNPTDQGDAGQPAGQDVTESGGESADPGEPATADDTIQLPQTAEGEGVQTSPDGGGTNRGSGAGVTAGAGEAVQGEVGESGPDSNRVPPEYRTVVERYFSDPGES